MHYAHVLCMTYRSVLSFFYFDLVSHSDMTMKQKSESGRQDSFQCQHHLYIILCKYTFILQHACEESSPMKNIPSALHQPPCYMYGHPVYTVKWKT